MMLWGLLWMLFASGLQAAEEKCVLAEGETLTVNCPFNQKYASNKKAWQRLRDGEKPQTLVVTERSQGTLSQVQVGRYILRDDPVHLQVQMINLQVEDSGLYRCVVYYPPPKEPVLLFHPVCLVVTTGSLCSALPFLWPVGSS
uniref:Triggering receptor expressed on myeloid cells 1 n=1 Tax=Sciurus vulgaris TaxID=55149 RepID=A0A8D2CTM0_SCIVU